MVFSRTQPNTRKYFSLNAGVWLRMKNKFFGNYFQLTVCFEGFDSDMVWSENFHFKPFPDSRTKREREREPRSLLRPSSNLTTKGAPVRRPQTGLVASRHTSTNQAKINSNAARSCLYRAIWWIFFLGFVSLVFLYDRIWWIFFWVLFLLYFCIEEWYYIFVWQLRKCIQ